MNTPMLEAVLAELTRRKGRLPDICEALPEIQYSWLTKLTQGRIKDPSVNKIQALYDHLCGVVREATPATPQPTPQPTPEVTADA